MSDIFITVLSLFAMSKTLFLKIIQKTFPWLLYYVQKRKYNMVENVDYLTWMFDIVLVNGI